MIDYPDLTEEELDFRAMLRDSARLRTHCRRVLADWERSERGKAAKERYEALARQKGWR